MNTVICMGVRELSRCTYILLYRGKPTYTPQVRLYIRSIILYIDQMQLFDLSVDVMLYWLVFYSGTTGVA